LFAITYTEPPEPPPEAVLAAVPSCPSTLIVALSWRLPVETMRKAAPPAPPAPPEPGITGAR
jgi:hypothetical protein